MKLAFFPRLASIVFKSKLQKQVARGGGEGGEGEGFWDWGSRGRRGSVALIVCGAPRPLISTRLYAWGGVANQLVAGRKVSLGECTKKGIRMMVAGEMISDLSRR